MHNALILYLKINPNRTLIFVDHAVETGCLRILDRGLTIEKTSNFEPRDTAAFQSQKEGLACLLILTAAI